MVYAFLKGVVGLALRLFFRVDPPRDASGALGLEGPVLLVANHPAALIDPALVFALAPRRLTFLAKAPLFSLPVLGALLRALGALPVYRKKDGADTARNEGTLTASVEALVAGRALTIFPEGLSHSEPGLQALKTGAARIALEAARRGAAVRVVPVGLTYLDKTRFRSRVQLEVGPPLEARAFLEAPGEAAHAAALELTEAIERALKGVTLELEAWEDLPLLATAEALHALLRGEAAGEPGRLKAFARGMALCRAEQPERFEALKGRLQDLGRRLELLDLTPEELTYRYRKRTVTWFVVRNLLWLLALPAVLVGLVLFSVPYQVPAALVRARREEPDMEATVMLLATMLLAPLWWALLTAAAWWAGGPGWGLAALLAVPPLALFTRYVLERRAVAFRDAQVFVRLVSQRALQATLREEAQGLAREVTALAAELGPRVVAAG